MSLLQKLKALNLTKSKFVPAQNPGQVSYNGDVDWSRLKLHSIPLKFHEIKGDLRLPSTLKSLEGLPRSIGGELRIPASLMAGVLQLKRSGYLASNTSVRPWAPDDRGDVLRLPEERLEIPEAAAEKQIGWKLLESAVTRFCDSKSDHILDCDFNDDGDEFQVNVGFNETNREDESTICAAFNYQNGELQFQMGSFEVKRKVPADNKILAKMIIGTLTQVISFFSTAITAVVDKRDDAEKKIETMFQSSSPKHFIEVNLAWSES